MFDGIYCHMGNLASLSSAQTRSISAENPCGKVAGGGRATVPTNESGPIGPSRDLGLGWKVRPYVSVPAGEVFEVADIAGPGAIQSIWMTVGDTTPLRNLILRIYWDEQDQPSVECPLGDFFAAAYSGTAYARSFSPVNSLAVCYNPGNALNCYWPMPFRKHARITIENRCVSEPATLFYQVNYVLTDVPEDAAYFHAQFRRENPLAYKKVFTILDGIKGKGQYVGTYMAWGMNNNNWWGEGEIKFYLDNDIPADRSTSDAIAEHGGDCFPTICGTGTEDYFCGSYSFYTPDESGKVHYGEYSTAYAGVPQIIRPDGVKSANLRFGMYRWHIPDPIRFDERIAVTMQALGWREGARYLPLQDDIASVAYWYQTLPTAPFPALADRDALEII